jgi:hypothetical protein
MFGALGRLVLYRLLGARIMLGLTILGWLRNAIVRWQASRRRIAASEDEASGRDSAYQPSQGASQTVHRVPR